MLMWHVSPGFFIIGHKWKDRAWELSTDTLPGCILDQKTDFLQNPKTYSFIFVNILLLVSQIWGLVLCNEMMISMISQKRLLQVIYDTCRVCLWLSRQALIYIFNSEVAVCKHLEVPTPPPSHCNVKRASAQNVDKPSYHDDSFPHSSGKVQIHENDLVSVSTLKFLIMQH